MNVITRAAAIRSGLKWYYTGIACRNGHLAERQTSNRTCRLCGNEAFKRWAPSNRVQDKGYKHKHYEENKAEYLERARVQRRRNGYLS